MMRTEQGEVRGARPAARATPVNPVTITTASGLRVHGLQTGMVAVKAAHREYGGPAALRTPAILLDRRWTQALPILCWIIEHPEGLIVIDTGELADIAEPGRYFASDPVLRWIVRHQFWFSVSPAEQIDAQFRSLNLDPGDVRWVVQTHLHFDHAGGMRFFPGAEFLVSRQELAGHRRFPQGAAQTLWPQWFRPTEVEYQAHTVGAFTHGHALTRAGDVTLVPTPGHSYGHQSVLLDDGDVHILLAGDLSFDQAQLYSQRLAGISSDMPGARRSVQTVRRHLEMVPTVYLPSHDPQSLDRLRARQVARER
jgi:N-acyl homoserine lactone hydrolase